jgi:hypothetical protein
MQKHETSTWWGHLPNASTFGMPIAIQVDENKLLTLANNWFLELVPGD